MEQEAMLVQSIYYGKIGHEVTERLLGMFGYDGSFLLRDSETMPGGYCLCVRKAPFVLTYRLIHSDDGWFLLDTGNGLQRFRTLETLIESYREGTASDARIMPFTDPLIRTPLLESISSGREFAYMEMNSRDSSVG